MTLFVLLSVDWSKVEWNRQTFLTILVVYLAILVFSLVFYSIRLRQGKIPEDDKKFLLLMFVLWPITDVLVTISMIWDLLRFVFTRKWTIRSTT